MRLHFCGCINPYMFKIKICGWLCKRQTCNCCVSPYEQFSPLKYCPCMMRRNMKELMSESPAHIPKKVFQIQSRAGVFTLRAGTGSVQGVSSRSVALQRRPFHSHRGVFVLLREAIQQPHRARILLQPCAEWRACCVPPTRPDSPPFLCAQPIPPVPSFPTPSPKTEGGSPMGTLSLCIVPVRTSSPLSLNAALDST